MIPDYSREKYELYSHVTLCMSDKYLEVEILLRENDCGTPFAVVLDGVTPPLLVENEVEEEWRKSEWRIFGTRSD